MVDEHSETEISEEFGDGKALNTGATEDLISRRIKRFLGNDGPVFYKRPIAHIKHNKYRMAFATAVGGALAYYLGKEAGLSGADATNLKVAKTALMSYPGYKIATNLIGGAAYWTGHFLNGLKTDRYIERVTEPMGLGGATALAGIFAVFGASHADKYLDVVGNMTYRLPATITAGIPSAIIDTFTDLENTKWDMTWEKDDQLSCLGRQAENPAHICAWGPAMEYMTVSKDDNAVIMTITDVNAYKQAPIDYDWADRLWADSLAQKAYQKLMPN